MGGGLRSFQLSAISKISTAEPAENAEKIRK